MVITTIMKHLLISILALLIAAPAYAQTETSKAILVLDASASMWGRIEDNPKIEIARKVIREILSDWNPSVELGLMAYGHREKGNCEDIQTLIDVGPVNAEEMIKAADGLNPKGKTPLSRAVQIAAQKLRFTEDKATVILVSDGKESCDMDPCQAAKELEENGIDFTAHVIGFQVLDDARRQLRCLAENTGGKFLSADNADELKSALTSAVETVTIEPAEQISVPTLQVSAVPHEGGEPITNGVTYEVFEGGKASKTKGKLVDSSNNARTFFHLPAGAYHIVAEHEGETTEADVQVTDSKITDLVMVLDGGRGRLRIKAVAVEGGEPLEGVEFSVYESKADVEDQKKKKLTVNIVIGRRNRRFLHFPKEIIT
jgi:Ca-activated chloride channel family protein